MLDAGLVGTRLNFLEQKFVRDMLIRPVSEGEDGRSC